MIDFWFVAAQTGGNNMFNLQFLQEETANLNVRNMIMNKDQVKGIAKDIAGKVQERVGKLVGSREQQIKGRGKQIYGNAQKVYGDAREAITHSAKHS